MPPKRSRAAVSDAVLPLTVRPSFVAGVSTPDANPYLPTDETGRLRTTADLAVAPGIWAAGDAAHVGHPHTKEPVPTNALWAIKAGDHLGQDLHGPAHRGGVMTDTPQLLLAHHLKALKLPTFLREHDKLARQCAAEGVDHTRYLLRLAELELIERERRMVELNAIRRQVLLTRPCR